MNIEELDTYQKKMLLRFVSSFSESLEPILEMITELMSPIFEVIREVIDYISSSLTKEIRIRIWWYQYKQLRGIK